MEAIALLLPHVEPWSWLDLFADFIQFDKVTERERVSKGCIANFRTSLSRGLDVTICLISPKRKFAMHPKANNIPQFFVAWAWRGIFSGVALPLFRRFLKCRIFTA